MLVAICRSQVACDFSVSSISFEIDLLIFVGVPLPLGKSADYKNNRDLNLLATD